MRQALIALGARNLGRTEYRGSYALVGYKGSPRPTWVKESRKRRTKGPTLINATIPYNGSLAPPLPTVGTLDKNWEKHIFWKIKWQVNIVLVQSHWNLFSPLVTLISVAQLSLLFSVICGQFLLLAKEEKTSVCRCCQWTPYCTCDHAFTYTKETKMFPSLPACRLSKYP